MTNYSKRLLFGVCIALCFSHSMAAEKIVVKYKTGGSGTVEVLGIEGESVKLKSTLGNTAIRPLRMFDEDSLIRIIVNLNSRIDWTAKPKASTPDTSSTKKYHFVTAREFEVFREKYNEKNIAMHVEFYDIPSALSQRAIVEQDFGRDKYMAFGAFDTKRQYFSHFVADKTKLSKQIFSLEKGDKITVYGWGLVLGKPTDIGGQSVYFIVDTIKKR